MNEWKNEIWKREKNLQKNPKRINKELYFARKNEPT